MSVVVLGMEMPDNCVECELYHNGGAYGGYGSCEAHWVIFGKEDDWVYETRPNWCPLRPLPERHGALIDRDALLKQKGDCYDHDGHLLYAVGTGNILCAPTIVEAEGKDDD